MTVQTTMAGTNTPGVNEQLVNYMDGIAKQLRFGVTAKGNETSVLVRNVSSRS